mmetsp:Transcript_36352/g.86929  ORF Transcript_36352/g.86929 Transcript_36352/m.86929 type:complete len:315 (+) Transcript_36352:367-1311(+)
MREEVLNARYRSPKPSNAGAGERALAAATPAARQRSLHGPSCALASAFSSPIVAYERAGASAQAVPAERHSPVVLPFQGAQAHHVASVLLPQAPRTMQCEGRSITPAWSQLSPAPRARTQSPEHMGLARVSPARQLGYRFALGEKVRYWSESHRAYLHATVMGLWEDGYRCDLDIRRGALAENVFPLEDCLTPARSLRDGMKMMHPEVLDLTTKVRHDLVARGSSAQVPASHAAQRATLRPSGIGAAAGSRAWAFAAVGGCKGGALNAVPPSVARQARSTVVSPVRGRTVVCQPAPVLSSLHVPPRLRVSPRRP